MVPKSLPPVQTILPNLPAPDQPVSVPARSIYKVETKIPLGYRHVPVPGPIQSQPTAPVTNSFNIIKDNEGNVPYISCNMPYPKYQPNIVPADTPSSPRVPRYKLRPRKNLSHTGGIYTRYNLEMNLIQMMEANSVIHPITGVPQEYRHLCKGCDHKIWKRSVANKLGKLAQGIRNTKGTLGYGGVSDGIIFG